jgi:hypothetical protein
MAAGHRRGTNGVQHTAKSGPTAPQLNNRHHTIRGSYDFTLCIYNAQHGKC